MENKNVMRMDFLSVPENEGFARVVISAFAAQLNPTLQDIEDIKVAVSEAVTNAIIHGYSGDTSAMVRLCAKINESVITIEVTDMGIGIEDIEKAKEPLFTSKPDMERSGMGFSVMESFMDTLEVVSSRGRGTTIVMTKKIDPQN